MKEVWRTINGFNTNYAVSSDGNVKSLTTGKFLKPSTNHKGYLIVQLSMAGKRKNKRVHRLVAEAFIPNPDNLPEVDHINGDKKDNKVTNLRWVTGSVNTRNREFCRRASSKYNGVYFNRKTGKYHAGIWVDGATKYLGTFVQETQAALAFNLFCTQNRLNRELNLIEEA